MFKNIIKGVVVASVLVGLGTVAEAGQSFSNFSTTVGRFGGSGYTSYQTKAVTGQRADVYLFNNGGYRVDVRTNSPGSSGTWSRGLSAGSKRKLSNRHSSGSKTRLQFRNRLNTRVNTQARGIWRSN